MEKERAIIVALAGQPNVGKSTVFNLLTNRDYLEKKFVATGSQNIQILECGHNDNTFTIKNIRDVESDPPAAIRKFVKATNTLTTTDNWEMTDDIEKKGTFEVDVKGLPIKMKGDLALKPNDKGCTYEIIFNVSDIPSVWRSIK